MTQQLVRVTAGKILRSETLEDDEKSVAAAFLAAHPECGNPHAVRCGWCHATATLFRDEGDDRFTAIGHRWRCDGCNITAASQEIKI